MKLKKTLAAAAFMLTAVLAATSCGTKTYTEAEAVVAIKKLDGAGP